MNISIKREQNQASLSFAERKKFRPKVKKNRLLTLLALLLTAVTGAWATTPNSIVINGTPQVGDKSISLTYHFDPNNVPGLEPYVPTLKVKCAADNKWDETLLDFFNVSSGTTNISLNTLGEFEAGKTYEVCFAYNNGNWVDEVFQSFVPAAPAGPKHLITATYREQTRSLEQPLPYATTIGELFESVSGGPTFSYLVSTMSGFEMPLTGISSNNTSVVSIGELNGASTPVTVIADGKATISINFGSYAHGIFVSVTSPLYAYMKDGTKDADKWTASTDGTNFGALPIGGLKGDGSETVTLQYTGRLKVKGVKATSDAGAPAGNPVDLSQLTADYEAQDGDILSGETSQAVTIAAGATITLNGITITENQLICAGDATIILADGSTNAVTLSAKTFSLRNKAAVKIGGTGTTLTINGESAGTGSLTATAGNFGAGIGTDGAQNSAMTGGNIEINGGTITASCAGSYGSGIGTGMSYQGNSNTCGTITINGGTITATGASYAAGIGMGMSNGNSGIKNTCGAITIGTGVTKVTATKGSSAPYSIGKGSSNGYEDMGTITIGGTVYYDGSHYQNGGEAYLGTSPFNYPPSN